MYLRHYGIKGMRWGVRRYQNQDGTLTEAGKKRNRDTLFVSGSSKTTDSESPYHRPKLDKRITDELDSEMSKRTRILVGDAPGIDRQVQDYLNSKRYDRVVIYGPGQHVRYIANPNWKSKTVNAKQYEVGSSEWLAAKDIAMTNKATRGLAITLDNGSRATKNNVQRLINQNKNVKVFEIGLNEDKWL